MFSRTLLYILVCYLLTNCVEPQNIELGGNSQWVVYGLVGEKSPPVIFIYSVQNLDGQVVYNNKAIVEITDVSTEQSTLLEPVTNDTSKYFDTNEFPFKKDLLGKFTYYSSSTFIAKANAIYELSFELGEESGKATIKIPDHANFETVEILENLNGKKILNMSIDVEEANRYYKWEVSVDQLFQDMSSTIDPISGDTTLGMNNYQISEQFLPNNFITDEKILSSENLFTFNLSNNLRDHAVIEESYDVNVRLRHYGKELVDYFESIDAQSNATLFDPFVEPVFVKSNIDGLIGVVGTFSYSPDLLLEYQP